MMKSKTSQEETNLHLPILFKPEIAKRWLEMGITAPRKATALPEMNKIRQFTHWLNQQSDPEIQQKGPYQASFLYAVALLEAIFHHIIQEYQLQAYPNVMADVLLGAQKNWPSQNFWQFLKTIYRNLLGIQVTVKQIKDQVLKRESLFPSSPIVEHVIVWELSLQNPALEDIRPLKDVPQLRKSSSYREFYRFIQRFFRTAPPFGPQKQPLLEMLQTPARLFPHSLPDQLLYIYEHWGELIAPFRQALLQSLDFIKEETQPRFPPGHGPTIVPDYLEEEEERYSPDLHWMPRLVLIAKSTLVWLYQLSQKYGRPIRRLDEIPDEELDQLSHWGFTGLWLIGIWQRSEASRKIKQLCGNPEAAASAYALYDYEISQELGGEAAFQNLKQRCLQRGIRLASDMVPNHTGIDSRWVIEHPDWFIQLPYSPFPSYQFTGPNLSSHPDVGIYIEDHYYDKTDAAVVFKRVDFRSGEERYIYHGNDGTSIPWNDTAQLNYLLPEVRETVIQTILRVARQFPIIRFDAAMTLTKKHFQRLWFPEPGSGGDIPSRAQFGMTREEFNRHMPREFWREVVDRVAQEAPDTLLLAEAFWFMEGYFVRTLGMHRVYNSAFMNMLKSEENVKYRQLVKNTLAFDPEILKRFVNFMNNPDEEPAVVQFGKGDKYFGVCTLMVTMPGLPMFGHGQIEGFAEKYGMEYARSYWEETPDQQLIARHEREIFPLMRKRYLFAEVENFHFFDVVTERGQVLEDVFAFSNRYGDERALIIYHNRYAEVAGWIRQSVPKKMKGVAHQGNELKVFPLAEALDLAPQPDVFTIFRDHRTGLEFIRRNSELWEKGLFVHLRAYQCMVLLDFREVREDAQGWWGKVHDRLAGRGVPSIANVRKRLFLEPIHEAFHMWLESLANLHEQAIALCQQENQKQLEFLARWQSFLHTLPESPVSRMLLDVSFSLFQKRLNQYCQACHWVAKTSTRLSIIGKKAKQYIRSLETRPFHPVAFPARLAYWWQTLLPESLWNSETFWNFVEEYQLQDALREFLAGKGMSSEEAQRTADWLFFFREFRQVNGVFGKRTPDWRLFQNYFEFHAVRKFLRIHRYQGVEWFHAESMEAFLEGLLYWGWLQDAVRYSGNSSHMSRRLRYWFNRFQRWCAAVDKSHYQVAKFLHALKNPV